MTCEHATLSFASSANAEISGYPGYAAQKRVAATLSNPLRNKAAASQKEDAASIHDAPPQSLRAWLRLEDRNEVTPKTNVIYVAAPPDVDSDVQFLRSWSQPQKQEDVGNITVPRIEDVIDYLTAFYHGLPVKLLPPKLCFASWDTGVPKSKSKSNTPSYIGLNTATECVRIRTRPSTDGVFTSQLNLDDILDAAISMLPNNAYALLLLVEHDLFESDDDEFVCGRAYGGSRVAVISTARYHPALDRKHKVERHHAWPASHCESYLQTCYAAAEQSSARPKKKAKMQKADTDHLRSHARSLPLPTTSPSDETMSPIQAAVTAHNALPPLEPFPSLTALSGLWLGRVCRTASHELGHCFGMDHCVYYACAMQGSSSLVEDARQPPYLCPVDLAKMLHASGTTAEKRYQALLSFCERHGDVHLFVAFAAWIRARLTRDYPQLSV